MATFTKRIDAAIRQLSDNYNTHWAGDGWKVEQNYSQIGRTAEFESFGEWYGGIKNLSMRFIGVTIPQGAVITSATISLTDNSSGGTPTFSFKIAGIDEDNTGEFTTSPIDDARTRTKTTAIVDWDLSFTRSNGTERASSDIKTIIQEIVDRGSWSSGNAMGIYLYDDGTVEGNFWDIKYFSNYPDYVALLTINYIAASASASPSASISVSPSASPSASGGSSPSVSVSASPSVSKSASPSVSPSASLSPSASPSLSPSTSASISPSPSPIAPFFGLKIAKPGYNILNTDTPHEMGFSSDYGTLKYFSKQTINILFDASDGSISAQGLYSHNLNYYPYVEVYVRVYVGDTPTGNYEYCPFFGSGATVIYSATYRITTTQIKVYGEINGASSSVWHFDFLIFIFKNNLNLS
jgi:hypothetical protein